MQEREKRFTQRGKEKGFTGSGSKKNARNQNGNDWQGARISTTREDELVELDRA